jgi:Ca2+-binding RTX toxin-like protein
LSLAGADNTVTLGNGKFIDYVEFFDNSGAGKFQVVDVSTVTNTGTLNLNFNVNVTDFDGDTAPGTLAITVDGSSNVIDGSALNDSLAGDANANTLNGLAGNDILVGGDGNDTMWGGSGSDTFKFGMDSITTPDNDVIKDFTVAPVASGGDVLHISEILTGMASVPDSVDLAVSGQFLRVETVNSTTARIVLDADGSAGSVATPVTIVTLEGIAQADHATLLNTLLANQELK